MEQVKKQVGIWGCITLSGASLGGGALEGLDLRLGEHVRQRSRALRAHLVVADAARSSQASLRRAAKSEQVGIGGAIALSAHYLGGCALEILDLGLGQHLGERSRALCAHEVVVEAAHAPRAAQTHSKSKQVVIWGNIALSAQYLGGGALEGGDLRLLEDGSECGGALVSDVVPPETAKHGRGRGTSERPGVSMGADRGFRVTA